MQDPRGLGRTRDPSKVPAEFRHLVGWEAYRGAIDELLDLSRSEGFRLLLISTSPNDDLLKKKVLGFAEGRGVEVLDIGQVIRAELQRLKAKSYLGSPFALSATDGHPSALSHHIAGEALFEHLSAADAGGSLP